MWGAGRTLPAVPHFLRLSRLFVFAWLWFGVCSPAATALAAPATVLLRVPPGQAVPAGLGAELARWRDTGAVSGVLWLTQGRSEKPERTAKFTAFAVLEFAGEAACERWLREAAPRLPAGVIVRRADVLAHGELPGRDPARAVFVVNTYTPKVPPPRFGEFVRGYVQPLYAAMQRTGLLVRYTAYLERGATGEVDALNVLEYRDPAALAAMGEIKTKIRDEVAAAVPTYGEFDKIKDTLRVDGYGTTATYTKP
jgi:hypothetical protein